MMYLPIVTICLLLSSSNSDCSDQTLYFGLLIEDDDVNGARSGVENAITWINQNVLPNHSLHYTEIRIECDRMMALNKIFRSIFHSSHPLVAVIGAECSTATKVTAEISHYFNITQLLPSEVNLARVFYSIIKEYGWRRVAIIVQNERRYRAVAKRLKDLSANDSEFEVTLIVKVIDNDGLRGDMNMSLSGAQVRIFVIIADSKYARRLLCEAYQLGYKYPKYLFLTYGSYESQWWASYNDEVLCTPTELAEVLQFSLAALHFPSRLDGTESPNIGQSLSRLHKETLPVVTTQQEGQYLCYDATTALALALHKIIKDVHRINFTYSNNNFVQMMKAKLEATNFTGKSGLVHFDENGIRHVAQLRVLQYRTTYVNGTSIDVIQESNSTLDQLLRMVEVAYVGDDGSGLEFLEANFSVWPSHTPHDGVPRSEPSTVYLPVILTVIFLDVGGIVFAVLCLIFNIVYRNKKLIRLNSPNLNYLMIAGIILMYCSSISFAIPTTNLPVVVFLCFNRMWLLTYGYHCGFGAVVVKMWRIYYIFRNVNARSTKSSSIKDRHLIVFVLILLLINVLVMFIHIVLEGLIAKFNVATTSNVDKSVGVYGELEIPVNFFTYECTSHPWIRYSMQAMIFSSAMVLQACALYLAFQIRKVKVKGLNDAKYTITVVYISTILSFVTLILSFTLSSNITIYVTVYGVGIWMSSTLVLAIIFAPKMVSLLKDPRGQTIFSAHEEALQSTPPLGRLINNDLLNTKRRMKQLEDAIVEYRKITGLDLCSKSQQLTTSTSMMNLCQQQK